VVGGGGAACNHSCEGGSESPRNHFPLGE
jgi:hypothetical protein